MALATILDIIDTGALSVDSAAGDAEQQRAERLLELASAQVCLYFGVEESDIATWTANERRVIAGVVAECAAQRITSPASATGQQLPDGTFNWTKSFLTPAMKRTLNTIRRGSRGTSSVAVTPSSADPVEWTNWPWRGLAIPYDEDAFS